MVWPAPGGRHRPVWNATFMSMGPTTAGSAHSSFAAAAAPVVAQSLTVPAAPATTTTSLTRRPAPVFRTVAAVMLRRRELTGTFCVGIGYWDIFYSVVMLMKADEIS